jgi:hypothetical protein
MVPVVGEVEPTTPFATTLSPGPPRSVPVPKQLSSASGRGLEIQPTVSDNSVLTIVVTNYWSFSTCLRPLIVHHRPYCPML